MKPIPPIGPGVEVGVIVGAAVGVGKGVGVGRGVGAVVGVGEEVGEGAVVGVGAALGDGAGVGCGPPTGSVVEKMEISNAIQPSANQVVPLKSTVVVPCGIGIKYESKCSSPSPKLADPTLTEAGWTGAFTQVAP